MAAVADSDLSPYAAASYEHQTNPFYQWSGTTAPIAASADSLIRLRAGLDARLTSSRQTLLASAEVRRFDYRTLTFLGRTEELLDGSYQWHLSSLVDGDVGYRHEHRMVPFEELANTRALLMETEGIATAAVNVTSRAGWRIESRLKRRSLASPRPGVPRLDLDENSIHEAVRHPLKRLSVGFDGEYLSGTYTGAGILGAPRYHQTTLQLAAERRIAQFSTFEGAVGYTWRDETNGAGVSEFTGLVGYRREISSKTSAEIRLRRAINSYVTDAGSEIDTDLALRVVWQPTAKVQVEPSFILMRSVFPGRTFAAESSRHDQYRMMALDIHYQVLDWLALHPYVRHALRSSSVPTFGFDASAIGLELVMKESK